MHTNEPRELQGVELGYDPRDIHIVPIIKVVVWFFVLTAVAFGAMAIWFIKSGQGSSFKRDVRKPAITGPVLQSNVGAKIDIMQLRQKERDAMTTYETNKDGSMRIPVEHALDLIAERGLPQVTSNEPARSPGTTIPQNAVGAGTSVPHTEIPASATPTTSGTTTP